MPPNPRRNAQIAILVDMSFTCTKETKLIPFVSSIIPDNIGTANERFILKKPSNGEITTENKSKICN